MKKTYDILFTHVDYLAPDMTLRRDGTIAIRDGIIAGFEGRPEEAEIVLPGERLLVLPGFTDGHIHTSQQLIKGRLLDEKPIIWKRVNVPLTFGTHLHFAGRMTQTRMRYSVQDCKALFLKAMTMSPSLLL